MVSKQAKPPSGPAAGPQFLVRTARKAESRARVVEAARAIAESAGVSRLTLDAVAVRAGLSKAAVLFHFRSKHGLLAELLREDAALISDDVGRTAARARAEGWLPAAFDAAVRRLRRTLEGTGLAEALRQALAGTEGERAGWRPVRQTLHARLTALARGCGLGSRAGVAASLGLLLVAFSEEIPGLSRVSVGAAVSVPPGVVLGPRAPRGAVRARPIGPLSRARSRAASSLVRG
jgi:AcrR family transcriptional regulator